MLVALLGTQFSGPVPETVEVDTTSGTPGSGRFTAGAEFIQSLPPFAFQFHPRQDTHSPRGQLLRRLSRNVGMGARCAGFDAHYRGADIFVSSSWFEAFSLPVLEAMACGTPVVTTDSGGILDFCTHMESAYIVPPKKPERLARGMYEVLSNEVLYTRLADGGRASASRLTKANFAANIVNALEDIYTRGYAI